MGALPLAISCCAVFRIWSLRMAKPTPLPDRLAETPPVRATIRVPLVSHRSPGPWPSHADQVTLAQILHARSWPLRLIWSRRLRAPARSLVEPEAAKSL